LFDIERELKNLPGKPGVYIMKNEGDDIIYVGKAVNIKKRVRQYFLPSVRDPKTRALVKNIASFEYIVTDNELEALILECNLIKVHTPRYNVMLKDDKTYPFLKITVNETFPRVLITRKHVKDKGLYFGPFTGGSREMLDVIGKIWPVRKCSKKLNGGVKGSLCLNFYIGRCLGPCSGRVKADEYAKSVDDVIRFLSGRDAEIIKNMEAEMNAAAERTAFETAAELRDKINILKKLREKQKIERAPGDDKDILAFAQSSDEALVQAFFVRDGKMTGRERIMMSGVDSLSPQSIMAEFIKRFYGETTYIPKEIIIETDTAEKDTLAAYLSGVKERNVTITCPKRGEKLKLAQLAAKNARLSLEQIDERKKREQNRTTGALEEIGDALGVSFALERIECYDVSNLQGFESVASMTVFENGKPKRGDYRKFKIKSVSTADDYASIYETITRRLTRYVNGKPEFSKLPDIMFIDGGQGQVHAAQNAMNELNIDIPACGLVKDDRHRTRGLIFNGREITLPHASEGFKLITRIQDETHRFAIEYHRKLRMKKQVRSLLDDIPGVGSVRRKALVTRFGDIEGVSAAKLEELEGVVDKKTAKAVYEHFRKEA
jgi:excinuclease ABC subunit C